MRALAVLLAALALTTPAAAQDGSEAAEKRTVEGAHKFLADFFDQNAATGHFNVWTAGSVGGDGKYRASGVWVASTEPKPSGYRYDYLEGDVADFKALARCTTGLRLDKIRTRLFFPNSLSVPLNSPPSATPVIDWSVVQKVRVVPDSRFDDNMNDIKTGESLIIIVRKGNYLTFRLKYEEDATRVAFAMDFLREQCGNKTLTGF